MHNVSPPALAPSPSLQMSHAATAMAVHLLVYDGVVVLQQTFHAVDLVTHLLPLRLGLLMVEVLLHQRVVLGGVRWRFVSFLLCFSVHEARKGSKREKKGRVRANTKQTAKNASLLATGK